MVTIGVVGFAVCSALCGATPTGAIGEAWMIAFRVAQGAFAAVLFPAALAIVVRAFPLRTRGRALAVFFGITGALTAVGPLAGGYLTEWTWRAIFWINVPVAIVALVLIAKAKPEQERRDEPIDLRGAVLASAAMGLIVLGLQQAASGAGPTCARSAASRSARCCSSPSSPSSCARPRRSSQLRIFSQRAFAVDTVVLLLMSAVFVPLFFFASVYAQASLGDSRHAGGHAAARLLRGLRHRRAVGRTDPRQARREPAVVLGCLVSAIGFYLWGGSLTELDFSQQWYWLAMAGAGLGLVLGPVSTDALNRAPDSSYGEVTGVTQTARNLGASLGLAVMGSMFISQNVDRVETTLTSKGLPAAEADRIAHAITSSGASGDATGLASHAGSGTRAIFEAVQLDIAHSTQTIAWVMAGIMAVAFLVAKLLMPAGRVLETTAEDGEAPDAEPIAASRAEVPAAA